nr:immunoglobulin heavy chain junction region [Mus musculus]
CARGSAWFAYW